MSLSRSNPLARQLHPGSRVERTGIAGTGQAGGRSRWYPATLLPATGGWPGFSACNRWPARAYRTPGPRSGQAGITYTSPFPLVLVCWEVLVDHHIHRNPFTGFSVALVQDVQNQTIIFDNQSTIFFSRGSILLVGRGH